MSKRRLSNILTDALSDRLSHQQQAELRNAIETIETANKSVGDVVLGGRHISRVSLGNIVLGYGDGLTIINPENGHTTVRLAPNGDSQFGNDLGNVGKIALSIFANAQRYNGESMGDGDLLLGDNSSGKANLLWDRSTGRLNFRGGQVANAYIDTTGYLFATGATISGTITATAGAIGGWTITSTLIRAGSGSTAIVLDSAAVQVRVGDGIALDGTSQQIRVGAVTPRLVLDGTNKNIRTSTYAAGLQGFSLEGATGDAEFNNITARGEIRTTVLTYSELLAHAGTLGVFKSAGKLKYDVTTVAYPTAFSVHIEDPDSGHVALFAVSDVLWMKDATHSNYVTVQSVNDSGDHYYYVCQLQSGTPTTFYAGAAVADYGQTGAGFLLLTADDANGPFYSVRTWVTNPWTGGNVTERVRLGNMKNAYGTGANNRYGIGLGDYASGNYLSYNAEAADAFKIKTGGGVVTLDANGINIDTSTSGEDLRSYKLSYGGSVVWKMGGYTTGGLINGTLIVNSPSSYNSAVFIAAYAPTSQVSEVRLATHINSVQKSNLRVRNSSSGGSIDLYTAGVNIGTAEQGNDVPDNDLHVGNDARLGGGLYVGSTVTDPPAGEILANGRITSGNATNAKAAVGQDPAHLGSYAGFWNAAQTRTTTNYCLLQDSAGLTYLNAETGKDLTFQIGNVTVGKFEGTTGNFRLNNKITLSTAVGCRVYHSAAQSINSAAWTALAFNSERFDNDGIHDTVTSNGRLTAQTAGVYLITGYVEFASNNTGIRGVAIRRGGTQYIAVQTQTATQGNVHQFSISAVYDMAATNYVELMVYQTSGAPLNVTAVDGYSAEFSMVRIA